MKAIFPKPEPLPPPNIFKPDIEFVRVCIENQDLVRIVDYGKKCETWPPATSWNLLESNLP